ncbi:MAG: RnfABCDGE type electron transport complex subunit G [Oscillospiraceae bacterium]|nr:RnfABCDGE type electron transport complex subunit G [Oscillospiraceae bacterium]
MKNEMIRNSLILFILTATVALLLGTANYLTKDIIAELNAKKAAQSREMVLGNLEYDTKLEINENLWEYEKDGEIVGYAVMVGGVGYSGTIRLMIGLDKELRVLGVDILEHTETPGLGAKAQAEVSPQFIGKESPFSVVKANAKNSEIQAITGATITTRAIVDIVNSAINLVASD